MNISGATNDTSYYVTKQIVRETSSKAHDSISLLLMDQLSVSVNQALWNETRAARHPSRSIIMLIDREVK
jgi:hypothetical protein